MRNTLAIWSQIFKIVMRSLLIDGYNLLHVTDLFGQGAQVGTLEGAREALLAFLASRLSARQRVRTRIVFDAAGAPPGLPMEYCLEGIRVLFARDYPDADAMLEALIERSKAPKDLLVISGDRRVQRAARRRGAAWVDSSEWYREVRLDSSAVTPTQGKSPANDQAIGDVDFWVNEFSRDAPPTPPEEGAGEAEGPSPAEPTPPSEGGFPPGYAQELAEEFERTHPQPDKPHGPPPADGPAQPS